jgi:hypothetical protein
LQALFGRELACPIEHRRGYVDSGRPLRMGGEGADDEARATSDIEDGVIHSRTGGIEDHAQRFFIGNHRSRAEGRCLASELVENQVPVSHLTQLLLLRCVAPCRNNWSWSADPHAAPTGWFDR